MHILLISQYWEPEQGVVQRRWQWISSALIEAGHELTVVCPPPHYPGGKLISEDPLHQTGAIDNSVKGIHIYRTRFKEHNPSLISRINDQKVIMLSQLIFAHRAVRDAHRNRRPIDIVCCTVPALPSAPVAYIVSRLIRAPLVVELRDAWPEILEYLDEWRDPQPSTVSIKRKAKIAAFHITLMVAGKILHEILRRAEAIITTTESLAQIKRKTARGQVVSVRNGVDPTITNCLKQANENKKTIRILYAGTVGRAQGLENAAYAIKLLIQSGYSPQLRIVGGGAHLEQIKKLVRENNLPIEFIGRIPFAQIAEHYNWCDTILVHLQSWTPMNYTVPSKLFEALATGKHITAAVNGEAAQIVSESNAGSIVPPMNPKSLAEIWKHLIENPEELNVEDNGHIWLQQNSQLENLEEKWIQVVEELLSDDT
ncbi:glycosyltransferase family 4 protein [Corynebacterium sp. CCM 9185]|uniref:Glycosyltransferase family 4 protein n=1 Tax=Corynebacterium marambiense TaxID=2765364 RepID=A0ABS0VWR3_9CORY|nr:glycosyltransferase family 4 protein [Corynebacterium marambiense]MBI9001194.1 glycosyltransferase family 4 protein [Corynebacterium marambiense]MCK7663753.1 glycosyltransferase family 4 protein [Corynebacterium marambiense]